MKKILAALLALMMIFAFCACGDTQEQQGLDGTEAGSEVVDPASGSDLEEVDPDEPRYTSDGELIVEVELPASDSNLSEDE
ncbi:MAG: hypothetical protein IJO94_01010 [Firmicutes bacterium]|nr:hypothetical protein [Bacillota bacterium]MBQ4092078.1 hypothetical protein [Bacillota bacterium]MBQ6809964.1 hypothetical protein [Bacillota bacterium]